MGEWGEVLYGLGVAELRSGFDGWRGEFPPNAIEFFKACRPDARRPNVEMYQENKKLPWPKTDPDEGKLQISRLRGSRK